MSTRGELRRRGEEMRLKLFGEQPAPLGTLGDEAVYGAIWCRPGLALEDRMLCTLAALAAVQRLPQLARYIGAALDLGLTPRAVTEVIIQIGIYAGFSASEEALEVAKGVLGRRNIAMPTDAPSNETLDALSFRGRELLQKLHGARGTQGYADPGNAVTGALYPLAIQYGYGAIWYRPGLEVRQRALVAVAAFTALKLDQVRKFGQSALNVGLSRTEVIEAIVQTAPYSGFAPALNALGALSEALG